MQGKMEERDRALLEMFKPDTYSIQFSRDEGKRLQDAGWVDWVPATFGSGIAYRITDAGKAALAANKENL